MYYFQQLNLVNVDTGEIFFYSSKSEFKEEKYIKIPYIIKSEKK